MNFDALMMQAAHERKLVLQAKEADRALRCARTAAARALEEAMKLAQVHAAQSFESNLCGVYHSIYGPVPCNRPYYECPFLSHAMYRQHKSGKGVVDLTPPCVHHPISPGQVSSLPAQLPSEFVIQVPQQALAFFRSLPGDY